MGTIMTGVVLIISTISVLLWLVLHLKYKNQFADVIEGIDPEEYQMPELFYIGFGFLELIHFNMQSDASRKKMKDISEIRGEKYAQYYYYVMQGAKATYFLTLLPVVLLLSGLSGEAMMVLLGMVICVLLVWYMDEQMKDKLSERREELLKDLPSMLSKMTLLINSGMIMKEAWEKVAVNGTGLLYEEMQYTVSEQQMGVTELESYENFAERCNVKEIRRFTSTLVQNLQKGNSEMTRFLKEMTDEMWELKKNQVRQQAEAANSKLLIPTAMIFIGILVMIMAPMIQSL